MKIVNSYYDLGNDFYKEKKPDKVKNPQLLIFNKKLAKKLNLELGKNERFLTDIFSGNKLLPNSKPISLAYAGHQFGNFVPQLGDGRACLIGEVRDKKQELHDIQLKGSGRSFFSRNGDGKCPLDAGIREYIVSEAMHYLKISTTRSLALVKSDEFIQRNEYIPASVITRVAKGHIRIGSFEYFAHRRDFVNLQKLADYTIARFLPKYVNKKNKYISLLKSLMKLQAELVSDWMGVGFIHGVMNTDNISVSGQTIDYGPCAFMDEFNRNQTFSFIDQAGRYSFMQQKNIIYWNIAKFAGAILPLIDNDIHKAVKIAELEINKFPDLYDQIYYKKMAKKIGFFNFKNEISDRILIDEFLDILENNKIDYTNGFRILSKILKEEACFFIMNEKWFNWQKKWQKRLKTQNMDFALIAKKLDKINPILIPRNHIIARIIKKAVFENDYQEFYEFLEAIEKPYLEYKKYSKYYLPPKETERVINTFCGT